MTNGICKKNRSDYNLFLEGVSGSQTFFFSEVPPMKFFLNPGTPYQHKAFSVGKKRSNSKLCRQCMILNFVPEKTL